MKKKPTSQYGQTDAWSALKRVLWWAVYVFDFGVAPPLLWQEVRRTETLAGELIFKLLMLWGIVTLLLIGRLVFLIGTRKMPLIARKEAGEGYLCILPWLIGFATFTLGPMIFSVYISMCDWDIINAPRFVGFDNFQQALFHDFRFVKAITVTVSYAAFALPLGLMGSLLVAILLNQNVKGMTWFRTIYYIPAILPGIATAMLWRWIFNPQYGILNGFLINLHLINVGPGKDPPGWIADPALALPSFVIMSLWGIGGGMIIYLAGLQSIPTQLYEAAEIDGANWWHRFHRITIPMISPTIFFNLVMGVIGSFQVFTSSFVMTQGGPAYATLFYLLYLYQKAFQYFQMGYAAAMAWILFVLILLCTLIVFKSSARWVYYEADVKGRR